MLEVRRMYTNKKSLHFLNLKLKKEIEKTINVLGLGWDDDGWFYGCQNRDLDHRIARFYNPTLPKCLESH